MDRADRWLNRRLFKARRKENGKQIQSFLDRFWNRFQGDDTNRKLKLLKEASLVRIFNPVPYKQRRSDFDTKVKGRACGCCGATGMLIRHHIVTLKNGGTNKRRNLIKLCEWCHFQIHPYMEEPEVRPESMSETMQRVEREAL